MLQTGNMSYVIFDITYGAVNISQSAKCEFSQTSRILNTGTFLPIVGTEPEAMFFVFVFIDRGSTLPLSTTVLCFGCAYLHPVFFFNVLVRKDRKQFHRAGSQRVDRDPRHCVVRASSDVH